MFEGLLQDLIDEFSRLPGIGPKSGQRIAFHLMCVEPEGTDRLRDSAAPAHWRGAAYLGRLLRDFPDLSVTRLASGIPLGGDLEFVDELTLSRAEREAGFVAELRAASPGLVGYTVKVTRSP